MAIIEGGASSALLEVESDKKAGRVVVASRGDAYCVAGITGTIAAALAANSTVFAMRLDPSSATRLAFIERIRMQYTTVVAYTTPVTAARRLAIYRGSGAASSGGTAISTAFSKDSTSASSEFNSANGGDVRIATTGALTVTGITYETPEISNMCLTHVGAAGAFFEEVFEFSTTESSPLILQPGQLLAVRNPAAMDAAGTWQLAIRVDWHETTAW